MPATDSLWVGKHTHVCFKIPYSSPSENIIQASCVPLWEKIEIGYFFNRPHLQVDNMHANNVETLEICENLKKN